MQYQRIMMKLSGGAMSGGAMSGGAKNGSPGWGFDPTAINHIADEVLLLHQHGIQVAVMVGGGNIFKGEIAQTWGIERAEGDNMGMMATVINSLLLRGVLQARGEAHVRVMTAIPINAIAEPYIRLRAIRHLEQGDIVLLAAGTGNPYVTTDYPAVQRALELRAEALLAAKNGIDGIYSADPKKNPQARRYTTISYDQVIAENLRALDQSAVLLARDHHLPIHVFDFNAPGVMLKICSGEEIGTRIGDPASAGAVTARPRMTLRPGVFPVDPADYPRVVEVWEASVRATHHFVKEEDIRFFRPLVTGVLPRIAHLACVRDEAGQVAGFVGVADGKVEMLFLHPDARGQGAGSRLLRHALAEFGATTLDVNEQNEQAVGFYLHMGFEVAGRSELDDFGKPYPLLHMRLMDQK